MRKCAGSGTDQMLAWPPAGEYPGAVVCADCSFGVPVLKGSAHEAVSMAGHQGQSGTVRVHYVSADGDTMSLRMRR